MTKDRKMYFTIILVTFLNLNQPPNHSDYVFSDTTGNSIFRCLCCVCQVEQEQKRQETEKAKINEEERKAKRHEKEMIRQVRQPHRLMYIQSRCYIHDYVSIIHLL